VKEQEEEERRDQLRYRGGGKPFQQPLSGEGDSTPPIGMDPTSLLTHAHSSTMSHHLQRQHSRQLEDVGSLSFPTLKRRNTKTESLYIIPFEIHAYEALLMTVKALETQEFTYVHDKIQSALQYFKDAALIPIKV
jgi:hypothetical protein